MKISNKIIVLPRLWIFCLKTIRLSYDTDTATNCAFKLARLHLRMPREMQQWFCYFLNAPFLNFLAVMFVIIIKICQKSPLSVWEKKIYTRSLLASRLYHRHKFWNLDYSKAANNSFSNFFKYFIFMWIFSIKKIWIKNKMSKVLIYTLESIFMFLLQIKKIFLQP